MPNVDELPESPFIVHAGPRPPSRISSTQLTTPVDHLFAHARYSLPPYEETSSKVAANPPKLESDDGQSFEFRWHLRSKPRGLRGRSGDNWAEDLLRRLGAGGATGRRRWHLRSSICALA